MALTPSAMVPLGTPAPDFELPDAISGRTISLSDFRDAPVLLVMFICNHCPYVKHVRAQLAQLARDYEAKGVAVVAINSNDATTYPEDSPENMKREAREAGYHFPYLVDETQEVARRYQATCTPDFFVYDADRRLVYRGQLDDSRPGNGIPVTGRDLREALDAALSGQTIPAERQRPSAGCNIKWK